MRIKITENNLEKINEHLDETQSRARVRTIDAQFVYKKALHIKEHLKFLGVPYKYINLDVIVNPHADEHFANSYNGRPETTFVFIEFKNGNAYYTESQRDYISGSIGNKMYNTKLNDEIKKYIIEKAETLQ